MKTSLSEMIDINLLSPNEQNPRIIKRDDLERLKEQIKRLGLYKPLLVDKNNVVLGGNARLRILKDLKYKEVWISRVDPKTEAERLEFIISDNDSIGVTDAQMLAELITEFENFPTEIYKYLTDSGKTIKELLESMGPSDDEDMKFEPQYQVVIDCEDENKQKEVYEKLQELDYKCKILTL